VEGENDELKTASTESISGGGSLFTKVQMRGGTGDC